MTLRCKERTVLHSIYMLDKEHGSVVDAGTLCKWHGGLGKRFQNLGTKKLWTKRIDSGKMEARR